MTPKNISHTIIEHVQKHGCWFDESEDEFSDIDSSSSSSSSDEEFLIINSPRTRNKEINSEDWILIS